MENRNRNQNQIEVEIEIEIDQNSIAEVQHIRNVGLHSGRPVKNYKMFSIFLFWMGIGIGMGIEVGMT